jgi:hypothetical protein
MSVGYNENEQRPSKPESVISPMVYTLFKTLCFALRQSEKDVAKGLWTMLGVELGIQEPLASNLAGIPALTLTEEDYLRAGNKIPAIKSYRERTGYGLKDAKDCVEFLGFKQGLCDASGSARKNPVPF